MAGVIELPHPESEYTETVRDGGLGPQADEMYRLLTSRVIGQDTAARDVAAGFDIYNAGLKEEGQPIGVFLFIGPTGWGKTTMAQETATYALGGDCGPLTPIACGMYSESHRVSELIGAPSGYKNHEEMPRLAQMRIDEPHFWVKARPIIESLRKKPLPPKFDWNAFIEQLYHRHKPYRSVLLFDEVEKAHSDFHDAMLHVMSDGRIAVSTGTTVFDETVLIATSNVGGAEMQSELFGKRRVGFRSEGVYMPESMTDEELRHLDEKMRVITLRQLERTFKPEFIGRIRNSIVVFHPLKRSQTARILDRMLAKVQRLVTPEGRSIPLNLQFSEDFKEYLLQLGVNQEYGIRPLGQIVLRHVKAPLAAGINRKEFRPYDELMFRMVGGAPRIAKRPALQLPAAAQPPSATAPAPRPRREKTAK